MTQFKILIYSELPSPHRYRVDRLAGSILRLLSDSRWWVLVHVCRKRGLAWALQCLRLESIESRHVRSLIFHKWHQALVWALYRLLHFSQSRHLGLCIVRVLRCRLLVESPCWALRVVLARKNLFDQVCLLVLMRELSYHLHLLLTREACKLLVAKARRIPLLFLRKRLSRCHQRQVKRLCQVYGWVGWLVSDPCSIRLAESLSVQVLLEAHTFWLLKYLVRLVAFGRWKSFIDSHETLWTGRFSLEKLIALSPAVRYILWMAVWSLSLVMHPQFLLHLLPQLAHALVLLVLIDTSLRFLPQFHSVTEISHTSAVNHVSESLGLSYSTLWVNSLRQERWSSLMSAVRFIRLDLHIADVSIKGVLSRVNDFDHAAGLSE